MNLKFLSLLRQAQFVLLVVADAGAQSFVAVLARWRGKAGHRRRTFLRAVASFHTTAPFCLAQCSGVCELAVFAVDYRAAHHKLNRQTSPSP